MDAGPASAPGAAGTVRGSGGGAEDHLALAAHRPRVSRGSAAPHGTTRLRPIRGRRRPPLPAPGSHTGAATPVRVAHVNLDTYCHGRCVGIAWSARGWHHVSRVVRIA
jgi:hypothetical protein